MDKTEWLDCLVKSCEDSGVYKDAFRPVIETLAEILEQRDQTEEQFKAEGSQLLIEVVTDRGARNLKPNPLLVVLQDLNKLALSYYRELAISPKSLKLEPKQPERRSPLEEIIRRLEGDYYEGDEEELGGDPAEEDPAGATAGA